MKLKVIGVAFLAAMSLAGPASAIGNQTKEILDCTENSCLVRTCTTIGNATHCSTGWEPRLPNWGPGYPEEP